jgi:hypothetical protein
MHQYQTAASRCSTLLGNFEDAQADSERWQADAEQIPPTAGKEL